MANFAIINNAQFQPFTYQELALPLNRQEAFQENIEQQYEKLSSQADVLEAMGANDRDKNSKVYGQYKAYSDALRAEADNLYRNGLNSESRMRLTDLRRRYNQEIVPIQNAWNKREQEAEMQMKAQLQNPSLMFTRDARNSTLDSYIANPTGGFGVINGANITAQMAGMAKNLANRIRSGQKEGIDDYTYNYIQRYGLDENIIRNWRESPALSRMFEQVMKSNGVTEEALQGSINAQSIIDKSTGYAEMGMWNAIGEDKSQLHNDPAAIAALEDYYDARKQARAHAYKMQEKQAEAGGADEGYMFDTSEYELPMMGADFSNAKEQEDALKTLGYTMKNGKWTPTGKATIKYDLSREEVDAYNAQQKAQMELLGRKVRAGNANEAELEKYKTMQRMLGRYGNFKSPTNASTQKEVSLFNSDGTIMTRKQFMAQAGSSKGAQKAFGEYFDKMLGASKTMGYDGDIYTQNQLTARYNNLRKNSAAQMARVFNLNYEQGDWNSTSKNYSLQEISGYSKGKPVYKTGRITLDNLLNKKDSSGNKINVAPHWSNVNGQEGLILSATIDGKNHRYFISADDMPESNIQGNSSNPQSYEDFGARHWFKLAEQAIAEGNSEVARIARINGLAKLHKGLTIHSKGYDYSMVRQPSLKDLVGE